MGSEQSQPQQKSQHRAPPIRRGHTVAASGPDTSRGSEPTPSGNNSPGASVCSDTELPYISYTVNRPIGDSPKSSAKPSSQRMTERSNSLLQRRQHSLQARKVKKVHDIVVVKGAKSAPNVHNDEDIRRLQEIPQFLPIMRGSLGLTGTRDPDVLEGLDCKPWIRLASRYQAHLAACAQPLAADQINLAIKVKETDMEISRLHSQMVDKQRQNARHAERLSRVREISHQLSRCNSLLNQTLIDVDQLNMLLPEGERMEPFVWDVATN